MQCENREESKEEENAKKGRKMTLSSAASPPGFRPQMLDPECNEGGARANV